MAINFPDSPSNGDTHTVGGQSFVYDVAKNKWKNTTAVPAITSDGATPSLASGITATEVKTTLSISDSSSTQQLSTMSDLISLTGMATGDMAFVDSNKNLFYYNGTGWFKVATVTQDSPTAITGVNGTYSLANDGTPTTITAVSTDPEGFPLTWSYAVTSGSLGSTATVSQTNNVFTITPSTDTAHAGSFSITFSVTDGVSSATSVVSAFTLVFAPVGRAEFYKGTSGFINDTSQYNWTVPSDVNSICVLCIGAGGGGAGTGSIGGGGGGLAWKNNIPVTPGSTYRVVVGLPGQKDAVSPDPFNATDTSFQTSGGTVILRADGGGTNPNTGGSYYINSSSTYGNGTSGGGQGGQGGVGADGKWGGAGGAGGYTGNGGAGGYGTGEYADGGNGFGGGGGGSSSGSAATGGGGTGRYGRGSFGAGGTYQTGWGDRGEGGSGGEPGAGAGNSSGGNYGGGAAYYGRGGDATVQIIWGPGRFYPNTLTTLADDS